MSKRKKAYAYIHTSIHVSRCACHISMAPSGHFYMHRDAAAGVFKRRQGRRHRQEADGRGNAMSIARAYAGMSALVHVCILHVCVCLRSGMYVYACVHVCACVHMCVCTFLLRARVRVCLRVCVRMRACASVSACVCMCVHVCVRACVFFDACQLAWRSSWPGSRSSRPSSRRNRRTGCSTHSCAVCVSMRGSVDQPIPWRRWVCRGRK